VANSIPSDIKAVASMAQGVVMTADGGVRDQHATDHQNIADVLFALFGQVTPLTFVGSGTTLVNAALGNVFNLTLTASTTTLGNPSNPTDGQMLRVRITQGGAGSFTLAYGTAYSFGVTGAPTLSTAAGKVDILNWEYVGSISKWCARGPSLGF
jgi:hypothetical protein